MLSDTLEVRQEASLATPAVCRLLRLGSGSVQDLTVFMLGAICKYQQEMVRHHLLRRVLGSKASRVDRGNGRILKGEGGDTSPSLLEMKRASVS